MTNRHSPANSETVDVDILLSKAFEELEAKRYAPAFRLFLAAAKAGDCAAQLMLGNLYSAGTGVGRNRAQALRWYKRAYHQGYGPAATNIAVMLRNESKLEQALTWFKRAVALRDVDANLDIANIYIERQDITKARQCLKRVLLSDRNDVTNHSKEEAQRLLHTLQRERRR
jgi:TPR repeat protein